MSVLLVVDLLACTILTIRGPLTSPCVEKRTVPDQLSLIIASHAAEEGAVCLDGSAPGYYFRPGSGLGNASWIIFFEGGAWCYTNEDCLQRSTTALGSSLQLPLQMNGTGILSDDPAVNPDFHNWNVAYLAYCDGASFAGDRATPVPVGDRGQRVFFRGKRIRDAILEELLRQRGLSNAMQVLVGGCSAGGLAAFLHCDHTRGRLPPGARVKCFSDAGMFLDVQ